MFHHQIQLNFAAQEIKSTIISQFFWMRSFHLFSFIKYVDQNFIRIKELYFTKIQGIHRILKEDYYIL